MVKLIQFIESKQYYMKLINYEEKYKDKLSEFISSSPLRAKKCTLIPTKIQEYDKFTEKDKKFRYLVQSFKRSNNFKEIQEKEFNQFVEVIRSIEKKSKESFVGLCNLTFSEVCRSIINLINPSLNTLNPELAAIGFKIFRKIIELENYENKNSAAKWETKDYIDYQNKIKFRQGQISKLGIVDVLCKTISVSDDINLKNEAILLSISMLVGGNEVVQEAFYDILSQDTSNGFFVSLVDMIEFQFFIIKKRMDIKNRQNFNRILREMGIEDEKLDLEIEENQNEHDDYIKQNSVDLLDSCTYVFRFLQLLCEGHYSELQNFLRVQSSNGIVFGKTINLLKYSSLKFGQSIKFLNIESIHFCSQIVEFMIEAVQGPCIENQRNIIKEAKVVEFIKDFLSLFLRDIDYQKKGFTSDLQRQLINTLITKSTKLLYSMIEGNPDDSLMSYLNKTLEFEFLFSKIEDSYSKLLSEMNFQKLIDPQLVTLRIKSNEFPTYISDMFNTYILIKSLATNFDSEHEKNHAKFVLEKPGKSAFMKNAQLFYEINCGSIEIYFQNNLHRIFFPIQPPCRHLSSNTRNKLMEDVPRDSPNDKLLFLSKAVNEIFDEMLHSLYLKKKLIKITTERMNFFRDISTLSAIIILILSAVFMTRTIPIGTKSVIKSGSPEANTAQLVLGLIQFITSSIMLIFWLLLNGPLICKNKWRNLLISNKALKNESFEKKCKIASKLVEDMILIQPKYLTLAQAAYILKTRGPDCKIFNKSGNTDFGHFFIKIIYWWINFKFILSESTFLYMIFYIVFSINGTFQSEIFYCFHLLDITNRSKSLQNVIKSVTKNGMQIVLTLFLGVVTVFFFSVIGFFFLNSSFFFNHSSGLFDENLCSNMFMCFMNTLNFGFRLGGGIGDAMTPRTFENKEYYYTQIVYKNVFFWLINVIFLNIIFGIIIDTFAELRDQKNRMDEDMKNVCFICNIGRYSFDRHASGFEAHIKSDHRLWNYIFYIYYIQNKDSTEFTGIESEIAQKVKIEDISWFPILKAICLENTFDEEFREEEINEKVNSIKDKMNLISNGVDVMKRKINNK